MGDARTKRKKCVEKACGGGDIDDDVQAMTRKIALVLRPGEIANNCEPVPCLTG